MRLWNDLKISRKIVISIFIISTVLTVVSVFIAMTSIRTIERSSLREKGSSLAVITAETLKPAVQYNVGDESDKILNQLVSSDGDVSVAAIVTQGSDGAFIVTNKKTSAEFDALNLSRILEELKRNAPPKKGDIASLGGDKFQFLAVKIDLTTNDLLKNGYLILGMNTARISRELKSSTATMAGLGLFMMSLGTIFAFFVGRTITKPLRGAVSFANALSDGDLSTTVVVNSRDEVGQLLTAMQNMARNLKEMISKTVNISNDIASASNELQAASAHIASGAENVAVQAEAVATASEEMAATSSEIAKNCTMAAEAYQNTTTAAGSGAIVVQETIKGMTIIAERVKMTSLTIDALGAHSEQIGHIVGTIEDIADQTNLLALNAAIEAARAGEQGRGFAVVADEVRALAERTTMATREIGAMIKAIQNETREAVKAMDEGVGEVEKGTISSQKSGQALEDILGRINEVAMQINQIACAAEEQTATTNEVTNKVQQISEVVVHTAREAGKTAGAAALLARQAQELQALVKRFKL